MLIAKVWNKTTGMWCTAGIKDGGPKEHNGKIWNISFLKSALTSFIRYGGYNKPRSVDHLEVVIFECKELTRLPAGEWRQQEVKHFNP